MYEFSLATALGHPLGQLVVTVIVAAVTAVLTVRIMSASSGASKASRRPPAAAAPARDDAAIVAAISAAVYAVIGAHRIVYLAETPRGSSWTAEMRTQHHTSHTPHH